MTLKKFLMPVALAMRFFDKKPIKPLKALQSNAFKGFMGSKVLPQNQETSCGAKRRNSFLDFCELIAKAVSAD